MTLLIVTGVLVILRRVRTPYYRPSVTHWIRFLESVITGQATENQWQVAMAMTIRHNDSLESIRLQCLTIEEQYYTCERNPPYLFTQEGLRQLQVCLARLKTLPAPIDI